MGRGKGRGGGGKGPFLPWHAMAMDVAMPWQVPPDVTLMERAVLDLNQRERMNLEVGHGVIPKFCEDLWNGQNLDANSLLALRCLPQDIHRPTCCFPKISALQEQAMDLLGSLYSKGFEP